MRKNVKNGFARAFIGLLLMFTLALLPPVLSLGVNIPIPNSLPSVNNNTLNVNNTLYWQGHTGTDGSWLTGIPTYNSSYVQKNQDLNLTGYNIYADYFYGNGIFDNPDNFDGIAVTPSGLSFYTNSVEIGSITSYGGVYFPDLDLYTNKNITALNFIGSGKYLTNLSTFNTTYNNKISFNNSNIAYVNNTNIFQLPQIINSTLNITGQSNVTFWSDADNVSHPAINFNIRATGGASIKHYGITSDQYGQLIYFGDYSIVYKAPSYSVFTPTDNTGFQCNDLTGCFFTTKSDNIRWYMNSVASGLAFDFNARNYPVDTQFRSQYSNKSLYINGTSGLVTAQNLSAHYFSSDGTKGFTGLGTSCAITEIKDGIITSATCV